MRTHYYAFFDVDGTILRIKTMFSFLDYFFKREEINANRKFYKKVKFLEKIKINRRFVNKIYYKNFANIDKRYLLLMGERWFADQLTNNEKLFIDKVIQEITWHKQKGGKVVLVSGSFEPCIRPLANLLKIDEFILTNLEVKNGKYTGRIVGDPNIGVGKLNNIRKFLAKKGKVDLRQCYAYGDHYSDLPMLTLAGNPCVVKADPKLAAVAVQRQWRIIQ